MKNRQQCLSHLYNNVFNVVLKVILEESTEKKQSHIEKLEATIKSLSAELLKVCLNKHHPYKMSSLVSGVYLESI